MPVALWLIACVLIFQGCDKNYFTFPCWLQESTLRFSRQLEDIAKRIFGLQPKETTARVETSLLLGKSPRRCLGATDTCNGRKNDCRETGGKCLRPSLEKRDECSSQVTSDHLWQLDVQCRLLHPSIHPAKEKLLFSNFLECRRRLVDLSDLLEVRARKC